MKKYACFTGHRDFSRFHTSLSSAEHAIAHLVEIAIQQHEISHFYSGMAIGTDLLAARVLCKLGLPWTAVIPCENQPNKWSKNWQKAYFSLLAQANSSIVLQSEYSRSCMNARNAWMVKRSDLLIAVWDEQKTKGSGTFNTVQMAMKKKIPLLLWNPSTLKVKNLKPKPKIQLSVQLNLNLTL